MAVAIRSGKYVNYDTSIFCTPSLAVPIVSRALHRILIHKSIASLFVLCHSPMHESIEFRAQITNYTFFKL